MKVLMIAPTPFFSHRGSHIRILEEARALEKRGHEIVIVTYHNGDDIHNYIETDIDVRRVRRWLFWYKKTEAGADWQKILLNIFLIRKVFYMKRTWKPDVIHAHLHEGVLIGRLMQVLFFWRGTPMIADFHGTLVGEMKSHGYLQHFGLAHVFSWIESWVNKMGNAAIVSSVENTKTIRGARGDFRTYHVYDGVDASLYGSITQDKKALRQQYGIPTDKTCVIYTGALIENKGIGHILEAAKAIPKGSDTHFVIGGYPAEQTKVYIKKYSLEDRVTIISPLNYFDLAQINSAADIAIDPKPDDSKTQQASGKILQYMAAALPIICADRPTNRKYLEDAGVYVSKVSSQEILTAIKELTDVNLRLQKGRHARKRAKVFNWDKVGEKIEGVYQSVIRREVL